MTTPTEVNPIIHYYTTPDSSSTKGSTIPSRNLEEKLCDRKCTKYFVASREAYEEITIDYSLQAVYLE